MTNPWDMICANWLPLCVDRPCLNKDIIKIALIPNLNIHHTFNEITHKICQISHHNIKGNTLKQRKKYIKTKLIKKEN